MSGEVEKILMGLGFSPLAASGLSLIANTAPVAYGALGTPLVTLAKVTDLPRALDDDPDSAAGVHRSLVIRTLMACSSAARVKVS